MTTIRRTSADQLVAPDDIVAHLRAAGHSVGRTRAAVVAAVRDQPAAFTADELAAAVPDFPGAGPSARSRTGSAHVASERG